MATIKPIETVYGGHKFRSRLEARWAVFFDQLSIKFEYEPEGFSIGRLRYLPDFRLPDLGCYVEIKPTTNITAASLKKVVAFAQAGNDLLFVFGAPSEARLYLLGLNSPSFDNWLAAYQDIQHELGQSFTDDELAFDYFPSNWDACTFTEDAITRNIVVARNGRQRLADAALFSKQARFEFGQTPQAPQR